MSYFEKTKTISLAGKYKVTTPSLHIPDNIPDSKLSLTQKMYKDNPPTILRAQKIETGDKKTPHLIEIIVTSTVKFEEIVPIEPSIETPDLASVPVLFGIVEFGHQDGENPFFDQLIYDAKFPIFINPETGIKTNSPISKTLPGVAIRKPWRGDVKFLQNPAETRLDALLHNRQNILYTRCRDAIFTAREELSQRFPD